jgi:hypothetical protein
MTGILNVLLAYGAAVATLTQVTENDGSTLVTENDGSTVVTLNS